MRVAPHNLLIQVEQAVAVVAVAQAKSGLVQHLLAMLVLVEMVLHPQ
jgi:hypothetical protein